MDSKAQTILALTNIENAAILGYITNPLAAITARLLRLELTNSETECEALERAQVFCESINEQAA